jgi:hypothetical protein
MKIIYLLLLGIITLNGCIKENCTCTKTVTKYGRIITATGFILLQYNNNAFDPKNKYRTLDGLIIQNYGWWNTGHETYWTRKSVDWFYPADHKDNPRFKLRYVGGKEFINPNSTPVQDSTGLMVFTIDSSLFEKPIFELYDTKDNRLYLRVIASKNAQIQLWDWNCPTTKELADTYNLYVDKADHDTIGFGSMAYGNPLWQ